MHFGVISHNPTSGDPSTLWSVRFSLPPFFGIDSVYTIEYSVSMRFEWDESKNRSNYKKHGVWFEEAQTIWIDSESVEFFDPEHSSNEDRFIRIGHSTKGRILLVVFARGLRDQRFALSLLEKQQRKK